MTVHPNLQGSILTLRHEFSSMTLTEEEKADDTESESYHGKMLAMLKKYQMEHGDCHVQVGKSKQNREEREKLQVSEELADWIVKQREEYNRLKGKRIKFSKSFRHRVDILDSMGFLWSARDAQWQGSFNRFQALVNYQLGCQEIDREAHPQIARWVDLQRKVYRHNKMRKDRIQMLREIDFIFDPYEVRWKEMFERLVRYKEKHGDTLVNTRAGENGLGWWVFRQRKHYQSNELTDERVQALESIGFSWDPQDDAWNRCYAQLCDFYSQHGHTKVPISDSTLWTWLHYQRRRAKDLLANQGDSRRSSDESISEQVQRLVLTKALALDGQGKSTAERMKQLKDLPIQVELHQSNRLENYEKLSLYKECYGHLHVTPRDDKSLSMRMSKQRALYGRGKWLDDRVQALEDIGVSWNPSRATWDRFYANLCKFRAKHGHCRVPTSEAGNLYNWVNKQRKILGPYRREGNEGDRLTSEEKRKILALDEIGFDWEFQRKR